jgi:hypothetical protein
MAVSNVNVGLGIGMSGETTAPDQIFRAQQQKDLAQTKAAQKKTDEEEAELDQIRKKILVESAAVHTLESKRVTEEMGKTMLAISQAKRTHPNDYLNFAYNEFGKYQNILNDAKTKTRLYQDLENKLQKKSQNVYVSPSLQKARDLMNESDTTEEWIEKLQKNGIQSNDYFNYDKTTGKFEFQTVPRFNPISETKGYINQHANELLSYDYNPNTKETKAQYGTVRTLDEAREIFQRKVKENGGSTVGVTMPYTGEQMAAAYFSRPEAMIQYADEYGLSGASEQEIVNHYLDNVYEPLAGKKDRASTKGSLNINIQNNMGGEKGSRMFGPDEVGTVQIGDFTVAPLKRITLGPDPIKFKANPTTTWVDGKTFKAGQPKNVKTQDMYMQEMYYLPVLIEKVNNREQVTRIVQESELSKLIKEGKRIDFKPYVVVGEQADLTKITDFNFDKNYFVPLESIESNIKNTFSEDKSGKQEFENWNKTKQSMRQLVQTRLKELGDR